MSFTRQDYIDTYEFAKRVYTTTRHTALRKQAKEIGMKAEAVVGQLEPRPFHAPYTLRQSVKHL